MIFILNPQPRQNAECYSDYHLDKKIILLCGILIKLKSQYDADNPHLNSVLEELKIGSIPKNYLQWARSYQGYFWSVELFYWLCKEYEHRFDKKHPLFSHFYSLSVMPDIISSNYTITEFPSDLPTKYLKAGTVNGYRHYYGNHFGKSPYSNRNKPVWINS